MEYCDKLRMANEELVDQIKDLRHLHEVYMRTLEDCPSVERMKIRHADNCIYHEKRLEGIYGAQDHFKSEQILEFANEELMRRLVELKTVEKLVDSLRKNNNIDAMKENEKALEAYCKKHNIILRNPGDVQ